MRELTRRRAVAELSRGKFRGRREVYSAKLPATCLATVENPSFSSSSPPSSFLPSSSSTSSNAGTLDGILMKSHAVYELTVLAPTMASNLHPAATPGRYPNLFRLSCKLVDISKVAASSELDAIWLRNDSGIRIRTQWKQNETSIGRLLTFCINKFFFPGKNK